MNRYILFFKCFGEFLLIALLFLIICFLTKHSKLVSLLGVLAYPFIMHWYIERVMNRIWPYALKKRVANKLTATLGNIDRIIYAIGITYKMYSIIAVWFPVKVASRLIGNLKNDSKESEDESFKEQGQRKNLYLIGNAISLFLGISWGMLIRNWMLQYRFGNITNPFELF